MLKKLLNLPLNELMKLASKERKKRFGNIITYTIERNINYTNVCIAKCKFCYFCVDKEDKKAFILDFSELEKKIKELIAIGGVKILLQGGLHPDLDIKYFEEMFSFIRNKFPNIYIHALSPAEILHISKVSKLSLKETILRLKKAGLQSVPGGGAELLVDRIRNYLAPNKISSKDWLLVMETLHRLGIPSTATMVIGFENYETKEILDTWEDRFEHLKKIKKLQEKTGGFTRFILWTYQPQKITFAEYLKMLAISRLYLDNIPSIQASIVTQGVEGAQTALLFGANDMGSPIIEENVVSSAGIKFKVSKEDILEAIREIGCIPQLRI